jgi:hypothetical protein
LGKDGISHGQKNVFVDPSVHHAGHHHPSLPRPTDKYMP